MYIKEIVWLHGLLVSNISDQGVKFTSQFWKSFQEGLDIRVNLSAAFHPYIDKNEERTIQTFKDML